VQDYLYYQKIDMKRPVKDLVSGMLPPKLAQVMINLGRSSEKLGVLSDPFCGSGTILQQALLLGYKKVFGSDKSEKAIKDSQINLDWIKEEFDLDGEFELNNLEVQVLSNWIDGVDSIVCEPYLGPGLKKKISKLEAINSIKELEKLYLDSLKEIKKVLKKEGRVVFLFPVMFIDNKEFSFDLIKEAEKRNNNDKFIFCNVDRIIEKTGFKKVIFSEIKNSKLDNYLLKRNSLIYGRENQKVLREIVVLENK
jgi:tRNA G10  N-methylase Trm11